MKTHQIYTQCTNCEETIEDVALYDDETDSMHIPCKSCNEVMIVIGWYWDDEDAMIAGEVEG
jgi:formate dehydrogenase maturation protein FdhE